MHLFPFAQTAQYLLGYRVLMSEQNAVSDNRSSDDCGHCNKQSIYATGISCNCKDNKNK